MTGAGRGIGHGIAAKLAGGGAKIAALSRTEANAQKTADELNATHGEGTARAYAVDVADGVAMAAVGKQVVADFGKVDILVN
ncbi:MAG: SDR family NAD(P)-dependent oxidoreductase, partial [Verrucomicrobiales bacterium]|nr:SDR family NAD(P)-dependent oxidoreductase [Verrucomicrobiales bacterium]